MKIREHKQYLGIGLAVLFFSFVIFRKYIFEGYYFFSQGILSDLLRANLPVYYHMYDSIMEGGNFWSWSMGIGTSMFTHGDVFFDPFTYLVFLFGREHIPDMMLWLFITKLVFEGVAFYAYANYFKIDGRACLAASVLYAFSGYSLIMGSNFALGTVLVYAPLVFLGIEKWMDSGRIKILLAGLFLTCIYSYYFFFIMGILSAGYLCVRMLQRKRNPIPRLFLLAALGLLVVLLSSFSLLPQLQLTLSSARVSEGRDVTAGARLFLPQIKVWVTAMMRTLNGDMLGSAVHNRYLGYAYFGAHDYFQISCFSSAYFVILLVQYWHYNKERRKEMLCIFGLLSVMTLFPVFSYIFNACATVNARWMFVFPVIQCLAMGQALNSIIENKGLDGKALAAGTAVSLAIAVGGIFLLAAGGEDWTKAVRMHFSFAKRFLVLLVFLYALLFLIYVFQLWGKHKSASPAGKRLIYILAAAAVLLDESCNYYHWYGTELSVCEYDEEHQASYEDTSAGLVREIQQRDRSFYRINKDFDSVYDSNGIASDNDAMVQRYYGLKNYNSVNNTNYIRFLRELGVYVAVPTAVQSYADRGIPPKEIVGNNLNYINGVYDRYHLMSYLGGRYHLAKTQDPKIPDSFELIHKDKEIRIYQNNGALPLAFVNGPVMSYAEFSSLPDAKKDYALLQYTILEDCETDSSPIITNEEKLAGMAGRKQDAFRLLSFSADKVTFEIDIPEDANLLSFSVPYDGDWHVFVDGKETETRKINISLLGAHVEPGLHKIVLSYSPRMFKMGVFLSLLTLIFLALIGKRFSGWFRAVDTVIEKKTEKPINRECRENEIFPSAAGRDSNIELCRVICMLIIIAHHCSIHGGAYVMDGMSSNKVFALFLIPGGKLCFDCFLAISCWFLADQKFKTQRFLKVWMTTLFYSVSFSAVACIFGLRLSPVNWIGTLLPIAGNSHGFAASYLAFYLLLPFLGKIADKLTKKQARWLMALLLYFEVFSQIIGGITQYRQPFPSELLLFILFYFIAVNLKRWPVKISSSKKVMLGVFLAIWAGLWAVKCIYAIMPQNRILEFIIGTMYDESSITNIVGGFALFFFFLNLRIKKWPLINYFASGTFGVLLIHDHNFFREIFWKRVFRTEEWRTSKYFVIILIFVTVIIFTLCFVIDRVRFNIFEKNILKNSRIQKYIRRCDQVIYEDAQKP